MAWTENVEDVVVLLCTVPDPTVGQGLAQALVGEGLAACVNILPQVRSVYRWQGEVCDERESLLLIKTIREKHDALSRRVEALHPYDTPELIALAVSSGLESYMQWVRAAVDVGSSPTRAPQTPQTPHTPGKA